MSKYKLTARQEAAIDKLKDANIYHVENCEVVQIAKYFKELFERGLAIDDPRRENLIVRYVEGLAGFLDADGKAKTDFKSLCDLAGYIDEDELIITPEGDIYLAMHD